jgi:two-component system, OmpR family, phosphate regulon response regulator OmpR
MQQQNNRILVVDDDPGLRDLLNRYLGEQGFSVAAVENATDMDLYLADHDVDLLILDLMLPGEDGLSIAKRLRAEGKLPILMLSARSDDVDRIVGLEVGADDYLPKPFNPRELLARIRAILRRQYPVPEEPAESGKQDAKAFGPFIVNLNTRAVMRGNENIDLTSGEFALLQVFLDHPNRVLSRDSLMDMLKGYDRSPFDRSIDVKVARLRRKIESIPTAPAYIRTVWGEGYLFSPEGGMESN